MLNFIYLSIFHMEGKDSIITQSKEKGMHVNSNILGMFLVIIASKKKMFLVIINY